MQLINAELTKEVLSKVSVDKQKQEQNLEEFTTSIGVKDKESLKKWQSETHYSDRDVEYFASFESQLRKYAKENFSSQVESWFLKRKDQLDIIVYSLIRTKDFFKAKELYLRIAEDNEDFGELASKYSEGIERKTRGLVGPEPLSKAHPALAASLRTSKVGIPKEPIQIEGFFLITRVESYDPVHLDDFMREKMEEELFADWIDKQTKDLNKQLLNKCSSSSNNGVQT
tara:strand:+ start:8029 stop:8712 length:684 start_codon:yes stop_codon:yes gene_type:complete